MSRKITKLLSKSPTQMDKFCSRLTPRQLIEYVNEAEAALQSLAWRSAYMSERYGHGCGDQGHNDAVSAANARLTAVRKAMEFTYPKRGEISV